MAVTNGVISLGNPSTQDSLQGTVNSNGAFTGSFNYCGSSLPITVTGTFSLTGSFTLSGSNSSGSVSVVCQKR